MGSRENDKLTSLEFRENDKLTGSDDLYAWKMLLDLKLEDHDLLDHVTGKIQEPPSNASAAVRKKGEIRAKLLIRESINKSLVAYISELGTSKEMYEIGRASCRERVYVLV